MIFSHAQDIEDAETEGTMTKALNRPGLTVRILCALALLFLGLSHKMPVVTANDAALLAYASAFSLPDGTAPDLCTPSDQGKLKFSTPDCDACRLSASVLLPEPPQLVAFALGSFETAYPLPVQAAIAAAIDRSQTARGPPEPVLS